MAPRFGSPRAAERVLRFLEAKKSKDASYRRGQILGSMCTAPHPLAAGAHALFLDSNLGDAGHVAGSRWIESDYVDRLFGLAGGRPAHGAGQVTSGGTEANLLALTLMHHSTGKRDIIVPATGHFSFEKAARILGLRLVVADVDADFRVRPEDVRCRIGPETAGIVGVAGSTQVGSIDPIARLSEIATEHGLPLHVDAAFGAYVLPFLPVGHPARAAFGFDLPGVTSVAVDSHKMGMGTMGAGALLVREEALMEHFSVPTPYLSVPRQRGILGTRSAGPVAAAWSLLAALGARGYRRVVARCLRNTRRAVGALRGAGIEPLIDPPINILAVPCERPAEVERVLARRGWRVNVLPRLGAIRLVLMPHVTERVLDAFLPDLIRALGRQGGVRPRARDPVAAAPAG